MNLFFTFRMAARESRSSRRRIGLYMGAITLGVTALVAINSFRANVSSAISRESRNLLGADLELRTRVPFGDSTMALLDSAAVAGTPVSYLTSFASMALAPRSGLTRLVEVRAVSGDFPYYGAIETEPADRWRRLQAARRALVDQAVLIQLAVAVGDTLRIGDGWFVIDGVLTRVPGEVALRAAMGPRVYIPGAYLEETGLLQYGSRARYAAYLRISDNDELQSFINRHNEFFESQRIGYDTASEREAELAESLDMLARYLGLVGLIALLLGGIGVASAVHVFVKDKLETVAILRCIGSDQQTVFAVYLLQAAALGLVGSAAGVVLGILVQLNLPGLLADFLPLEVRTSLDWNALFAGLALGGWVALIFGLLPLLEVWNVTPLAALRRDVNGEHAPATWPRYMVYAALLGTIVTLSVWQAPERTIGFVFAGAILTTTAALWAVAWGLIRATKRFLPRRAPYVFRQGIANLFRPHNQTVAVTLAVGFGVFLLGTLHVVQRNLVDQISMDTRPDRPNLVVFDIQEDQQAGVEQILAGYDVPVLELTPIVPARVHAVNSRTVDELLADTVPRSRWPLRREYRNTYRDTVVRTEEVVAGQFHDDDRDARRTTGLPAISMEEDVARELHVWVGDRITWDVQGVLIETEITSIRRVNWARFELNFFAVFETGVLEPAPKSFVSLMRVDDVVRRAELQRDLVQRYPNVAAIDLTLLQRTLDTIFGSVALAIRFMALFSIAAGTIVLVGAIATSRFQRLRESVLLKTLGARGRQVRQVLFTEYLALGTLAGITGVLLAGIAGWALIRFFFELTFALPIAGLAAFAVGAAALTTAVGLWNSRDVLRQAPLAVMREMGE